MADSVEDARVRAQYDAFPYPERDPCDEAKRLIAGSPSDLREIEHYLFAGRRDRTRPFRVLVAGGGTGDALVMLAQQLADAGETAEIVYLDGSKAARAVAEARIAARGLGAGVRFVTGSLLDVADLAPGPFDYVDCCGVLHHLDSPEAGLRALRAVLAPEGGMGLMLYGKLGRTGVYETQALLRMLAPPDDAPADRLAVAKRLVKSLPPTNWLKRNPYVGDHLAGGDPGLYDLLLHDRDRAYLVPEVAALCAEAGMRIAAFVEPIRYDPDTYLDVPVLRQRLTGRPWLERCAAAELLAGNLRKHIFYAVPVERPDPVVATADSPKVVPVLREAEGPRLAQGFRGGALAANVDGLQLRFLLPPLTARILERVDGVRSIGTIHAELRIGEPKLDWIQFKAQFDALYAVLGGINRMLLRRP